MSESSESKSSESKSPESKSPVSPASGDSARPDDRALADLLRRSRTIALVGFSPKPHRDSYRVGQYLKAAGYAVYPVNPAVAEIDGEPCYPDLASVPAPIDLVDIFRRSDALPDLVDAAIAVGAGAVWAQVGIAHPVAAEKATAAGLPLVTDACIMVEHRRLLGAPAAE